MAQLWRGSAHRRRRPEPAGRWTASVAAVVPPPPAARRRADRDRQEVGGYDPDRGLRPPLAGSRVLTDGAVPLVAKPIQADKAELTSPRSELTLRASTEIGSVIVLRVSSRSSWSTFLARLARRCAR